MPFKDPERAREYDRLKQRRLRAIDPEHYRKYQRDWNKRNPERRHEASNAWKKRNKEKVLIYTKNYIRDKLFSDPYYSLPKNIRTGMWMAIRRGYKNSKYIKYLGCSSENAKIYIESKFLPGMTWNNHGVNGWHIDHIRPLSSFDLKNENDLLVALHYTNIQPLWARDNLLKHNKQDIIWKKQK